MRGERYNRVKDEKGEGCCGVWFLVFFLFSGFLLGGSTWVREREGECVREIVRERERVCVCERERERERGRTEWG